MINAPVTATTTPSTSRAASLHMDLTLGRNVTIGEWRITGTHPARNAGPGWYTGQVTDPYIGYTSTKTFGVTTTDPDTVELSIDGAMKMNGGSFPHLSFHCADELGFGR